MNESITIEDIGLKLDTGHYKRLNFVFHVDHWLEGIDISTAYNENGIYYINEESTPTLADIIKENIMDHVSVEVMDDD